MSNENIFNQNNKNLAEYLSIYKTESTLKLKKHSKKDIEKFKNCSDQYFISPIAFTVNKDQTVKLALD